MSIWAGIKHALNSTLGTSDFKPLDELIMYENKQLSASDNVYMTIPIETVTLSSTATSTSAASSEIIDICKFKLKVTGSIRVSLNVSLYDGANNSNYSAVGYVYVYINGVQKHSFYKDTSSLDTAGTLTDDVTGDISFNKGDIITLKAQLKSNTAGSSRYDMTIHGLKLKADVISNLVQIVE